ncbi:MAG: adenylosuccinate synthetase, partial [Candidatus Sulfotelmatobacter sp.]
ECVYQNLPGWHTSTEGITDFEKLHKPAREYLSFVAKETGAKVGMISTGPDRDHTILIDEFITSLKVTANKH